MGERNRELIDLRRLGSPWPSVGGAHSAHWTGPPAGSCVSPKHSQCTLQPKKVSSESVRLSTHPRLTRALQLWHTLPCVQTATARSFPCRQTSGGSGPWSILLRACVLQEKQEHRPYAVLRGTKESVLINCKLQHLRFKSTRPLSRTGNRVLFPQGAKQRKFTP